MHIAPKPISNHRLARFITWARLWFMWFQVTLPFLNDTDARDALAIKTRTVANLIFIAAVMQAPRRPRRGRAANTYTDLHKLALKRVRRLLRGRSSQQQTTLLARLLRTVHDEGRRLLAWLSRAPRGLSLVVEGAGEEAAQATRAPLFLDPHFFNARALASCDTS